MGESTAEATIREARFGFSPTERKTNAEWTGEPITEERWETMLVS